MPAMTPEDLHRFLEQEFPQAPPGIVVESVDDTTIRVRLPTHESHLRPGGTVSGPTLVWLVDLSFYLLIMGRLGPVTMAVTTNLNINFMRKPEPADLLGEGRLMKLGKTLAVGTQDGVIKLVNVAAWSEMATLKGHRTNIRALSFSPDGGMLISTGGEGPRRWDATASIEP